MKTTAQFPDGSQRLVRIHLSRNGAPFALVFGGMSYRTTGKSVGDMFQMRAPDGTLVLVDAAGSRVQMEV